LIKNGAVLVAETDDILRELKAFDERKILKTNKRDFLREEKKELFLFNNDDNLNKKEFECNTIEKRILEVLSAGELDIDSLVRLLECNAKEINEALIMLELSSAVSRDGNVISKL
jgi:predicted Rossmann fold nucleotide-binding protein DprA/Smf involved in DNA uptake